MTRKKKIRVVLLIVLPILLAAMFVLQQYVIGRTKIPDGPPAAAAGAPSGGGREIPVTIHIASEEEVVDGIPATGTLMPNEEVNVASEIQGKVTEISFKEGSHVRKGQVLVKLNDEDLQAQLKRYQFQEKTLSENVERQRVLFDREAISRQAFDEVVTQHNVLLADIELLNVSIDRTQIRAPFDAVVGFRYISEGSYISVGTNIATLVDYSTLKLEFAIPEKYIFLDLVGKPITFTTQGSEKVRHGRIYAMEPMIDVRTRTIILRAIYDNSNGELRPGMFSRITIPTSVAEKMVMVPTEAIVPSLEGMSVWLARDGKSELVPVETGNRSETMVEIVNGVTPGDSVIITGLMQIREGSRIRVTN